MNTSDVDSLLEGIVTLPSAPTVLLKVTELVADQFVPLSKVAQAISADPPISMKVLRLVNSAYYGLRHRVGSLEQAISLLGLKVVKNLVATATIFHTFSSVRSNEGLLFERDQFWLHCVSTGIIAKLLVQHGGKTSGIDPEEIFVAGLLHDVGKIVFEQHLHKKFEQALITSASEKVPLWECELESIGVTHAQLGGKLAKKWKLPDELVHAIYYHHPVPNETNFPYSAAIVNLADFVCYAKEMGKGGPAESVRFSPQAWESSLLSKTDLPTIMGRVKDSEKLAMELLSLAR